MATDRQVNNSVVLWFLDPIISKYSSIFSPNVISTLKDKTKAISNAYIAVKDHGDNVYNSVASMLKITSILNKPIIDIEETIDRMQLSIRPLDRHDTDANYNYAIVMWVAGQVINVYIKDSDGIQWSIGVRTSASPSPSPDSSSSSSSSSSFSSDDDESSSTQSLARNTSSDDDDDDGSLHDLTYVVHSPKRKKQRRDTPYPRSLDLSIEKEKEEDESSGTRRDSSRISLSHVYGGGDTSGDRLLIQTKIRKLQNMQKYVNWKLSKMYL